jgi:hypothetical protein
VSLSSAGAVRALICRRVVALIFRLSTDILVKAARGRLVVIRVETLNLIIYSALIYRSFFTLFSFLIGLRGIGVRAFLGAGG